MNDLETLLRNEFDELATTVPESVEPWRALQRKLARRRAVLVGAAAAAVLVAVAVVVPLSRHQAPATPVAVAPAPPPAVGNSKFVPERGTEFRSGPFPVIEQLGHNSGDWIGWVYTKRVGGGADQLCVSVNAKETPVNTSSLVSDGPECTDPGAHEGPVQTRAFPTTKASQLFTDILVVVADEGVHDLVFRDGAGNPVKLKLLTRMPHHDVYAAYFNGSTQGYGYDGVDRRGQHFSAIT